jgi:hypothetical protein
MIPKTNSGKIAGSRSNQASHWAISELKPMITSNNGAESGIKIFPFKGKNRHTEIPGGHHCRSLNYNESRAKGEKMPASAHRFDSRNLLQEKESESRSTGKMTSGQNYGC